MAKTDTVIHHVLHSVVEIKSLVMYVLENSWPKRKVRNPPTSCVFGEFMGSHLYATKLTSSLVCRP